MNEVYGPFSQALQDLFDQARRIAGISVRWKDIDTRLRLNMPRHLVEHRDAYCMMVKNSDPIKAQRCKAHCSFEGVHQSFTIKERRLSTCHASCIELREPIYVHDELIGYLLIGPYQIKQGREDIPVVYSELDALMAMLVMCITRLAPERSIERNDFLRNDIHPALKTLAHLVKDWRHHYTFERLAHQCGMSLSRLQHLCKDELGETLGALCDRALLHQAQDALRLEHDAVGSVARRLGFEDQRYFATWFKRVSGMTPTAWRKQQDRVDI